MRYELDFDAESSIAGYKHLTAKVLWNGLKKKLNLILIRLLLVLSNENGISASRVCGAGGRRGAIFFSER